MTLGAIGEDSSGVGMCINAPVNLSKGSNKHHECMSSSRRPQISPDSALEGGFMGSNSSAGSGGAGLEAENSHGGSREEEEDRGVIIESKYTASMMDGRRDERFMPRSNSRHQIEKLLDESLAMFHRDGPLVNPLDASSNAAGACDSTMEQRLRFVCSAKGFDYGIFWKFDHGKQGLDAEACVSLESAEHSGVPLFVHTSFSMFTRWCTGFGMPGRIGYTGNYEWHEDIRQLPAWSFQRKRQAEQAGIRTVIGVPIDAGVVEFGTTRIAAHNITTVQYVQKICHQKPSP